MVLPKMLAIGKFLPSDLDVSVSESNRKIDPAVEGQLEALWEAKVKRAAEEGRICYNGMSYRLNALKEQDGRIHLDFGTFEYKVRDGLVAIPAYSNLPEPYHRKGCYSVATVKTTDAQYVMVELSGKSLNPNKTDLLGGIMETNIELHTGLDVFKSLYAELEEEGCIRQADIADIYLRAIGLGTNTNVLFYFEVTLNISLAELLERFKKEHADEDIKSLISFSRDAYIQYLQSHPGQSKKLVSTLLII